MGRKLIVGHRLLISTVSSNGWWPRWLLLKVAPARWLPQEGYCKTAPEGWPDCGGELKQAAGLRSTGLKEGLSGLAALAAGLLLRLWFIHHYPRIQGDSLLYGDLAKNWLLHGIYGFSDNATAAVRPSLIRLPGYPFFLAVCFRLFGLGHYHPVLYAQAAIDLLSCVLIGRVARNLFGARAGMLALWLAALCPFTADYTSAPLTETLSLFCVALAVYSLERWRSELRVNAHFWLMAFAMGYAILLRPDGGLLAAAIGPAMLWLAWKRCGPQQALALVFLCSACALLPLTPWTARNWRTFHVIQPLAPLSAADPGEFVPVGFNRWYRTWGVDYVSTEEVYWNGNSDMIDLANLPSRAFDSAEEREQTAALLKDYNKDTTITPERDARFAELARQRIAAHPLRYYLALPAARLADMWLRPRTELLPINTRWWDKDESRRVKLLGIACIGLNVFYISMGAYGAVFVFRHPRRMMPGALEMLWPMLLYLLLRSALLVTIDNSEPRYTLECFPILFVLAAAVAAKAKSGSEAKSGSDTREPTSQESA